jgi:hypothetical protein
LGKDRTGRRQEGEDRTDRFGQGGQDNKVRTGRADREVRT